MELVFVRHAEPEWVRDGLGVDDPGLTDRGRVQAERVAARLADAHFDEVLVSPLRRTRETAHPVLAALGVEPRIEPWLAEIRAPAFEGTPAEQIERVFREGRYRPLDDLWEGLPGGESFRAFHERVTTGLTGYLADTGVEPGSVNPPLWRMRDPERRILVIGHGGTNAVALGHLLGIAPVPWEWERFVSFHASVSTVRPVEISDAWSFSLYRFADVGHLPDELQTV